MMGSGVTVAWWFDSNNRGPGGRIGAAGREGAHAAWSRSTSSRVSRLGWLSWSRHFWAPLASCFPFFIVRLFTISGKRVVFSGP